MKWIESLIKEVQSKNIEKIIEVLQLHATGHANSPPKKIKDTALMQIRKLYNDPKDLYDIGIKLANSETITGEEIGSILIAEQFNINTKEVELTLKRLADSTNWEVREWVASACSIVLTNNFSEFYPTMLQWTSDKSPNVRRAVAVAVKYTAKTRNEEFCEKLIDLLERLLTDSDPYVKKNLGAFAIGDGVLRYFPKQVLNRVNIWIDDENEQLRWNVAKIFSSAEGTKYIEDSIHVIHKLIEDNRSTVKRAVTSMMNSIKKRRPDIYHKYFGDGITIT
jgi:3-methyladenine DNA glycosylase AlkD